MGTIQQHALRIAQPLFRGFRPALRTRAMLAGVIPNPVQLVVLTILGMSAQGRGSTGQPLAQGLDVMQGQVVALLEARQMLFEYLLYCMLDHALRLTQTTVLAYSYWW